MFCAGADVNMSSRRAGTRSQIYNTPETVYLYYNSLISVLCREKKIQRQGPAVFCLSMLKLGLIVLLISCSGAFAAEKGRQPRAAASKKQQLSAPATTPAILPAKIDEALQREHRARFAEISAIEKASGTASAAALKPLLSDKSPLVRGEAASALDGFKYDPDPEIKAWAAVAAEKVDLSMR